MSQQHYLKVTDIERSIIEQRTAKKLRRINAEVLPNYAVFVRNLFNHMNNDVLELAHATMGISTEANELLDISKKDLAYGKGVDIEHLVEELGDLRFYYQAILNMLDMTDEDIRMSNMHKLMKRYPEGKFNSKDAQNRADKD